MISAFLSLIRYKELLLIAFLQLVIFLCVIKPLLATFGIVDPLPTHCFLLLMASTLCMWAAGRIVNDYFDTQIDAINRPDKVVVNVAFSKKTSIRIYQILAAAGLICGVILAVIARSLTLAFIIIAMTGLLWFYSASYKRQFLVGNVIIAACFATAPFLVVFTEAAFLHIAYNSLIDFTPVIPTLVRWTGGYTVIAFVIILMREIVNDCRDVEGDRELECHTMPVKWGILKSKIVVYGLIVLLLIMTYVAASTIRLQDASVVRYFLLGVLFPALFLAYLLYRAKTPAGFHQVAVFLQFMLAVVFCYSFVFYFWLAKTYHLLYFGIFAILPPATVSQ